MVNIKYHDYRAKNYEYVYVIYVQAVKTTISNFFYNQFPFLRNTSCIMFRRYGKNLLYHN